MSDSQFQDAYTLVEQLQANGVLSRDQASPILEALAEAYAPESDYGNLCYLYNEAQELRYRMRDIKEVRASKYNEAVDLANHQWKLVSSLLAQLALDEEHPGRAGGQKPQLIRTTGR
jgi:hypothetical protein